MVNEIFKDLALYGYDFYIKCVMMGFVLLLALRIAREIETHIATIKYRFMTDSIAELWTEIMRSLKNPSKKIGKLISKLVDKMIEELEEEDDV